MDEIWSLLLFAAVAKSPLAIFTFHHDNNHYLVTLWMYLLGPLQRYWILYRLPSIAAGIGTVALAGLVARRRGRPAMFAALRYRRVVHARGLRLGSSRLCPGGLFRPGRVSRPGSIPGHASLAANLLFVVSSLLGVLAHLTFVEFYLAAIVWSVIVSRETPRHGGGACKIWPACTRPPWR